MSNLLVDIDADLRVACNYCSRRIRGSKLDAHEQACEKKPPQTTAGHLQAEESKDVQEVGGGGRGDTVHDSENEVDPDTLVFE